eukprot:CAMPEP_0171266434 /NCGR_PEP_ID=MMETSP0790-20130122/58639_1 /TAXON_ID=2925 /ORGANISM="Alexandrium catenella, Strain OF101" /LENGTH=50 /DNA_ID=CAMNT_0011735135 /DNA_START=33 /DNA_END=182 /DNA_ORIENTATION=+
MVSDDARGQRNSRAISVPVPPELREDQQRSQEHPNGRGDRSTQQAVGTLL